MPQAKIKAEINFGRAASRPSTHVVFVDKPFYIMQLVARVKREIPVPFPFKIWRKNISSFLEQKI